eukprot:TRINITY_DN3341_c1_g4_i1.p1 TRINITY_DN3341_c1_g4~~TRINITY_DN3341_c1_g4_i1.p1  ORF type:complete len:194 (-),score=32.34 TRINITY_DN3341_c1_g4_i1:85-666(-)
MSATRTMAKLSDLDLADAVRYQKSEFIETLTGNKVSRNSVLCGSQNIRLLGKTIIEPRAVLRGDLANINIGRYSRIGCDTVIRPPYKSFRGGIAFFPVTIGDNVHIGDNTVVSAASIGSNVYIGNNCVIGRRCILKDACCIPDNVVLAPDTVVPPLCEFRGNPGIYHDDLPECYEQLRRRDAIELYDRFLPLE